MGGVGKSCLIKRYCEEKFVSKHVSTIGVDFGVKPVVVQGQNVRVNFWDLAGGDEYFEIRNEFYKDAQGAIVVFDVGDRASFDALDRWLREANNQGANNLVLAICAKKCDSKQRLVTEVEGKSGQPRAAHCTSRPLPRTARVCTACLRASS